MRDRTVQYPNRIKLVPVADQENTYDVQAVPGTITDEGTPLNKANLLNDTVGARYGLNSDGTINDAFNRNVTEWNISVPKAGWSTSANSAGWFTNQINVSGMKAVYNPIATLVITSAALVDDEQAAWGNIKEIETFDGYIICKATDKLDISINIRLSGV